MSDWFYWLISRCLKLASKACLVQPLSRACGLVTNINYPDGTTVEHREAYQPVYPLQCTSEPFLGFSKEEPTNDLNPLLKSNQADLSTG